MPDTWSPSRYLQFAGERTRAARDLLAQVYCESPRKIVDMGCGPGNSTALLLSHFPEAEILGIDSSPAMLAEASKAVPTARFIEADANDWRPQSDIDLVFANAVYQWVPDQISVLREVLAGLPPGGVLAVQMPDNFEEPVHVLMRDVAEEGPWSDRLTGIGRNHLMPVRAFFEGLSPIASRLDIWHSIYNHVLANHQAVVEWVKGAGLRPYIDGLTDNEREQFVARYHTRLVEAYPTTTDGRVLLRYPRLFIVAAR